MTRRLLWMGLGAAASELGRRWARQRWRRLVGVDGAGSGSSSPGAGQGAGPLQVARTAPAPTAALGAPGVPVAVVAVRAGARAAHWAARRVSTAWAGGRADARRRERQLRAQWLAGEPVESPRGGPAAGGAALPGPTRSAPPGRARRAGDSQTAR